MAEALSKIEELTRNIGRIGSNFKKDQHARKTSIYLDERARRLSQQYTAYKSLGFLEGEVLEAAAKNFERKYEEIYKIIDNYIPTDCTTQTKRAGSSEKISHLGLPETLDAVKDLLHLSQNQVRQLRGNVAYLTDQLAAELSLKEELEKFDSETERLEYVLKCNSESRIEAERAHTKKSTEFKQIIKNQNLKIAHLEETIKTAEAFDQESLENIGDLSERERNHLEKIRVLTAEITEEKEKNAASEQEITQKNTIITELETKINRIEKEKENAIIALEQLETRIEGDLTPSGRKNYTLLVDKLQVEIDKLNREIHGYRLLERQLRILTVENTNFKELQNKMENYEAVLKYIRDVVPHFTGAPSQTLTSDVNQFVACCNMIYSNLSEEKRPIFMQVIKVKLGGDAADLVNNSVVNNMAQLEELLIKSYIPRKTLQNWNDELKRAIQRPAERVLEFGLRVEKLMKNCKMMAQKEYTNGNEALITIIEKDAIKVFKQGLSNEVIKYHLLPIKKNTLGEIISAAEEIEEESESSVSTMGSTSVHNQDHGKINRNRVSFDRGDVSRNWDSDNRFRSNERWRQNATNESSGFANRDNYYNRNYSRTNEGMRGINGFSNRGNYNYNGNNNRGYGNPNDSRGQQRDSNGIKCYRCNRMGHLQTECRMRSEQIFCSNCKRYGHPTKDCRQRVNVATIENGEGICKFCQRIGHLIDGCPYKKDYEEMVANENQQGNEQGVSTDTVGPY